MGSDPDYQRRYREANREKIREQRQRYREANREKLAEKQRAYYQANKEKEQAARRRYREENPEKVQAQGRSWYENNRERKLATDRQYRKANLAKIQQRQRAWRTANRDKLRATKQEYYQQNRDKVMRQSREWYAANTDRAREQRRQYRMTTGYKKPRERERDRVVERVWTEQQGLCYLCERPIALKDAVIEHDHRCCAKQNTFCPACVRGVSCQPCNKIIAFARDDTALLQRVARNLQPRLDAVTKRLSASPQQLALDEAC